MGVLALDFLEPKKSINCSFPPKPFNSEFVFGSIFIQKMEKRDLNGNSNVNALASGVALTLVPL